MAKKIQPGKQNKLLKLIEKYYADLADFARQHVLFEMGTRHAFHRLMADAGKPHGWTLIAEQEKKVNGKTIRPDGTFKDEMNLVRGFWEAKDTADKLDAEIEKKRKAGYPLSNIIFEDTRTAVLYQHGQRILSVDMQAPDKLAELVLQFFRYIEPEIEEFEHAVDEFKERVPDLAAGLQKKIEQAHRANPAFKRAFADFFELCQTSLNPNISQAAVDEMLIQHILTERLIREIFDNPEFVRRNVIAAEVEKVMQAMTSQSFDRNTYLKELDRFYVAIEHAARTMTDFSDKQHFLNTVYERFFQGYSVKLADTMGIVYTPQEIVDFMCASVAEVLEKEFGKKLWSDDVYIIDPCTGTGNFIVNLIRRIPKAKLEDVYKHRLFANEIMLLPYEISRADNGTRLEILLLLRESRDSRAQEALPRLLADADSAVRFAAVQWVGEQRLERFRQALTEGLTNGATTRELFEAYLAALELLNGGRREVRDEISGQDYIVELLQRETTPPIVRRRALRALAPDHPLITNDLLSGFLKQADEGLRLEAVRTLRERSDKTSRALLQSLVAKSEGVSVLARAEAVMSLDPAAPAQRELLLDLSAAEEPSLRAEALRSLRGTELSTNERDQLASRGKHAEGDRDLLVRLLDPRKLLPWPKVDDAAAWNSLLAGPADSAAGDRIFYHPRGAGCFRCHEIDGRGGQVGPDLSNVVRTMPRERLIESVVNPSREIAPQFVAWQVVKINGTIVTGVPAGENARGERLYADAQGRIVSVAPDQIESAAPQRQSIMPDNLTYTLTRQELRDLVAYLLAPR